MVYNHTPINCFFPFFFSIAQSNFYLTISEQQQIKLVWSKVLEHATSYYNLYIHYGHTIYLCHWVIINCYSLNIINLVAAWQLKFKLVVPGAHRIKSMTKKDHAPAKF